MKGVFIPGKVRPSSCNYCFCRDSHTRFCQAALEYVPMNTRGMPDWCPLQEVELPDSETVTSLVDYYDKSEIHENCTVEVLTNTKTGAVSVGWWRNEDE